MTTVILNENRAADHLKPLKGPEARKMKITCCVKNTTGYALHYRTQLSGGEAEVEKGTILPGHYFVVQPGGEMHVQGKMSGQNFVSTFEKLQAVESEMDYAAAVAKRDERGRPDMAITSPDKFDAAIQMLQQMNDGVDLSSLVPKWYDAKGYISVHRVPKNMQSWHMAKLFWDGVQDYGSEHVLIWNHLTSEMYAIGKDEFLGEWYVCQAPTLKGEEMLAEVPVLSDSQIANLKLVPERDMPGINMHGLEGREVALTHYFVRKGMMAGISQVVDTAQQIAV